MLEWTTVLYYLLLLPSTLIVFVLIYAVNWIAKTSFINNWCVMPDELCMQLGAFAPTPWSMKTRVSSIMKECTTSEDVSSVSLHDFLSLHPVFTLKILSASMYLINVHICKGLTSLRFDLVLFNPFYGTCTPVPHSSALSFWCTKFIHILCSSFALYLAMYYCPLGPAHYLQQAANFLAFQPAWLINRSFTQLYTMNYPNRHKSY